MTAVQPKERLHHLDGIRGLAALAVVVGHCVWPNDIKPLLFRSTGLWVDFFFVLSGFVIAYNYQRKLAAGFGVRSYMWKRMARIYPAHFVMMFAMLGFELLKYFTQSSAGINAVHVAFERNDFGSFIASLALLQGMGLYDSVPWNGPSWSISTEAWTYLLFGLAFAWLKTRDRAVVGFTVAVILLSYVAILLSPRQEYLSVEADFGFFRCLIGFGMGVIAFNAYTAIERREAGPGAQAAQLVLAAIAVAATTVLSVNNQPITLLAPPLFFALVYLLAVRRNGVLERGLMIRPIQFLGRISYSLYISHALIAAFAHNAYRVIEHRAARFLSPEQIGDILLLGYVAGAILFGWLVWRFVEVPANAWLTGSGRKGRNTPEGEAGADPAF